MKKGGASSLSANISDGVLEATNKKREQAPLLPRVGGGITKATKKNKKKELSSPLIET